MNKENHKLHYKAFSLIRSCYSQLIMSIFTEHFCSRGFWLPNWSYCLLRLVAMETWASLERLPGFVSHQKPSDQWAMAADASQDRHAHTHSHARLQTPSYAQTDLSHSLCSHVSASDLLSSQRKDPPAQNAVVLFQIINQVRLLFHHILQTGTVPVK